MNKRVILLVAVLIFVLGLATLSYAQTWAEIIYGGYLSQNTDGTVNADTGIFVFNPNGFAITCSIQVFDKYGTKQHDGMLWNGGGPVPTIAKIGWNWITLGMTVATPVVTHTSKYTFRLYCTGQAGRAPVVEVKEVIYKLPGIPRYAIWEPMNIATWSEAALGGPYGTAKFKP